MFPTHTPKKNKIKNSDPYKRQYKIKTIEKETKKNQKMNKINFTAFSFASSGRDFDPRTRAFSDEELKPQPMIKKSRKQFVPDELKDDKYWARRRKNNIAAKRSRDARRQKENQIAMRARYLEKEVNLLSLFFNIILIDKPNIVFINYSQDFFTEFDVTSGVGATETGKHGAACPLIQISRCISWC